MTKSLNLLINKSKGDFIARQDADDYSDHERIKEQMKHCINNKYQAVFTRTYNLNKNTSMQNISYLIPYKILVNFRNPFIHGTLLINSKIIKTLGGYDENFYFLLQKNKKLFKHHTVNHITYPSYQDIRHGHQIDDSVVDAFCSCLPLFRF